MHRNLLQCGIQWQLYIEYSEEMEVNLVSVIKASENATVMFKTVFFIAKLSGSRTC